MSTSLLIIGLGNPGGQYEKTLHNAGALALDRIVSEKGLSWEQAPKNIPALIAKSGNAIYAKPTTFMNESGRAVQQLLDFYKLSPSDLIVVHDDIDVPMGEARVEENRGAGGHNGVQSIIQALGDEKSFRRVRIGVATKRTAQKEGRRRDVAKIVLKKPDLLQRKAWEAALTAAVQEIRNAVR